MTKKNTAANDIQTETGNAQDANTSTALAPREGMDVSTAAAEDAGGLVSYTVPPELTREFQDVLTEIEQGFGGFTSASKVWERNEAGETFSIINAYTTELFNRDTGELEPKHVFVLEMSAGDVVKVMQSDSSIRAKYAKLFSLARLHGRGITLTPLRFVKHDGQVKRPQPAFIFQTLPGFHYVPAGKQQQMV
jgi:hypothetical protein